MLCWAVVRFGGCFVLATGLVFAAARAAASELDEVLPDGVPGYGTPFAVTDGREAAFPSPAGWQLGGVQIDPGIDLAAGFDSAPNGAGHGSALLRAAPVVDVADSALGFGCHAGVTANAYPEAKAQNTAATALACGERAPLPGETVTLSAAYLTAAETGFAVTTVALPKPVAFTVTDLRASDKLVLGMFTVQPAVSITGFRFDGLAGQDRTDYREDLTTAYAPGGPGQAVLLLHGAQSRYADAAFNAETDAVLAGIEDDAPELWHVRLLAGAAHRQAAFGGDVTAPVLEAAIDWSPSDFDRVRLELTREIDDPDEVTAAPYTLSQVNLSLLHEAPGNLILSVSTDAENAAFLRSSLRETLFGVTASLTWQMNENLALSAGYSLQDRQAGSLRAANEQVVTLGLSWRL